MSDKAGVWVSSNYEHGMDSVFATEVEALRHALSYSEQVTFVPFGMSAHDVFMERNRAKQGDK